MYIWVGVYMKYYKHKYIYFYIHTLIYIYTHLYIYAYTLNPYPLNNSLLMPYWTSLCILRRTCRQEYMSYVNT
jgi:hypothetical protein